MLQEIVARAAREQVRPGKTRRDEGSEGEPRKAQERPGRPGEARINQEESTPHEERRGHPRTAQGCRYGFRYGAAG